MGEIVGYRMRVISYAWRIYEERRYRKFQKDVDAGDENLRMVLLEGPDGGRILVESIVDMKIRPTYRYSVEDLDLCADRSNLK